MFDFSLRYHMKEKCSGRNEISTGHWKFDFRSLRLPGLLIGEFEL